MLFLSHTYTHRNENRPLFICLDCPYVKTAERAKGGGEGITFLLGAKLPHAVCEVLWEYRWLCLLCEASLVDHIYLTPEVLRILQVLQTLIDMKVN